MSNASASIERPIREPLTPPKGALSSLTELIKYKGQTLYRASKVHSNHLRINKITFSGMIGCDSMRSGWLYYWMEVTGEWDSTELSKVSLQDYNIIRNNYNDWFLFPSMEDAEQYIKGPR